MRQPCSDDLGDVDIVRIQKRLIHLCAQAVEMAFVAEGVPLSMTPPSLQANDTEAPTWASSKNRSQAADEMRTELIRRFLTRNSGFIAGLKHSENRDLAELQEGGTCNNNAGAQAASQMCAAYFAKAAESLFGKFTSQQFKHLTCHFDAATACKFNVMEVHLSCDGLVVAAPLSLLPKLKTPFEKTSEQLVLAIQDAEPSAPLHQLETKDEGALNMCKKEKTSSRQKMLALNQSLCQLVHLQLSDTEPYVLLRPPKNGEVRAYYMDRNGQKHAYLWNQITKQSVWQSTDSVGLNHIVRLSCVTDEGEFAACLSLMDSGLAVMAHRDLQHKLSREQSLSLDASPEIDEAVKKTYLILKQTAAPWQSGMFGRRILDTYKHIETLPVPHVLLDICGPGIINDLQLDPSTTQAQLKELLVEFAHTKGQSLHATFGGNYKQGRWGEYVDAFHRLKKMWHIRLFWLLFAYVLEGTSPFAAIAGCLKDQSDSIGPRVIRVSYWHWLYVHLLN